MLFQLDATFFEDTTYNAGSSTLSAYVTAIQTSFGINWFSVTWQDLRKPLYSALGARLYIEWSVSDVTRGVHRFVGG